MICFSELFCVPYFSFVCQFLPMKAECTIAECALVGCTIEYKCVHHSGVYDSWGQTCVKFILATSQAPIHAPSLIFPPKDEMMTHTA